MDIETLIKTLQDIKFKQDNGFTQYSTAADFKDFINDVKPDKLDEELEMLIDGSVSDVEASQEQVTNEERDNELNDIMAELWTELKEVIVGCTLSNYAHNRLNAARDIIEKHYDIERN